MILSTRGVMIPINLVSSAMDSIRRSVVLFKSVPVPTSDPKSEFLCQLSHCCAEPSDPLNPPCTPGISPMPSSTTYHPYCHSRCALTEYLKQKLCLQLAKHLGRSLPAQVKQNVPLERNIPAPLVPGGVTQLEGTVGCQLRKASAISEGSLGPS